MLGGGGVGAAADTSSAEVMVVVEVGCVGGGIGTVGVVGVVDGADDVVVVLVVVVELGVPCGVAVVAVDVDVDVGGVVILGMVELPPAVEPDGEVPFGVAPCVGVANDALARVVVANMAALTIKSL